MSTIPCKRPKVPVVDGPDHSASYCLVPGCDWKYGPGVKTDVNENATRHRQAHRDAVPAVIVTDEAPHVIQCPCGVSCVRQTRSDADAWVGYHLSAEHGLVTC